MRGALMVCGTASDAGKTHVVTGLCRSLARRGVSVAPFKAQNMSLNSFVTGGGHEIGRAQGVQALAAGVEPEVAMNPVLLKPTGERTSQLVVMGRPAEHLDAAAFDRRKADLFGVVVEALEGLRRRFDVVVCEGAGNPAELNLAERDIVNLRLAEAAGVPAVIVGDIDRGGVFAALAGTVSLLPPGRRRLVKGFLINKLRGDPELLRDGPARLERICGVPTLGVLPWIHGLSLDAEDSLSLGAEGSLPLGAEGSLPLGAEGSLPLGAEGSLPIGAEGSLPLGAEGSLPLGAEGSLPLGAEGSLAGPPAGGGDTIDVAVVRFPRISNFTDVDALRIEPSLNVRFVVSPGQLGDPDLVVLPGTKATVADLDWMRGRRLDAAVEQSHRRGATVLGVCGGYQMLGRRIVDGVESGRGEVAGLGWLDVSTEFRVEKTTRQRRGRLGAHRVSGYEIHHGEIRRGGASPPWIRLDDAYGEGDEGATGEGVIATSLHGLLEEDGVRTAVLERVASRRGKRFVPGGRSFRAEREAQFDRLADLVDAHVDLRVLERVISEGAPMEAPAPS